GNKGKKSNGRDEVGDDIDDAMSSVSIDTYGSSLDFPDGNNGGSAKSVDDFKEGVEMLTEKRASTREGGLRTVIKFMLHSSDLEPVLAMRETVLAALLGVVRGKGTESQGVHALRALSVLCVCIGPEEEAAFRSLRRPLRSLITRSRHEGVRVGAVHTLALACFICSSDDDNTSETLDLLADVFSRTSDGLEVPDSVCAAALSGWGLLATTVSRSWVATRMTKQHLRVFRELLSCPDMAVRMEAGENLALLHESRIILGLVGGGG
ncbi:unnamed protein product, partial [Scytosiphon promiscuus]